LLDLNNSVGHRDVV
jgi:hypothetical protein